MVHPVASLGPRSLISDVLPTSSVKEAPVCSRGSSSGAGKVADTDGGLATGDALLPTPPPVPAAALLKCRREMHEAADRKLAAQRIKRTLIFVCHRIAAHEEKSGSALTHHHIPLAIIATSHRFTCEVCTCVDFLLLCMQSLRLAG
jgi:hypothetical protein